MSLFAAVLMLFHLSAHPDPAPRIATHVTIVPNSPGTFLMMARVQDLETGAVLAVPKILVGRNPEKGEAFTGDVFFSGHINPGEHTAGYTVKVERAGVLLAVQSATVTLPDLAGINGFTWRVLEGNLLAEQLRQRLEQDLDEARRQIEEAAPACSSSPPQ